MNVLHIQQGEVWVVDWYGRVTRVRVISSHCEFPGIWHCEELEGETGGPGRHLLVNEKSFLERESPSR